jgi:hypothetical protein
VTAYLLCALTGYGHSDELGSHALEHMGGMDMGGGGMDMGGGGAASDCKISVSDLDLLQVNRLTMSCRCCGIGIA